MNNLLLSIVVPVYNEAESIVQTLHAIQQTVKTPHEIIVVYDFDEDTTVPVLHRLRHHYPNLSIIKNSIAPSVSGALRAGFLEAKSPLVLVTMADLSDDLTQVDYLVSLVPKQADIACPSRYCQGGRQELNATFKIWLPRIAGYLLRLLTAMPTYDPTNSFRLYTKALLDDISLTSTISSSVTLEIVAKAHCLGYRIVELPTVWRDRQHGTTNFKLGHSVVAYLPWFLLALLRNRLFALPDTWLKGWLQQKSEG